MVSITLSYLWFKNALGRSMPLERWQSSSIRLKVIKKTLKKWKTMQILPNDERLCRYCQIRSFLLQKLPKLSFQNTACTKTSASQIWLDNFKSNLTEQALKEIETFPSNTSFKLCDCRKVNFLNQIIFLVEIANKLCNAEIVLENIPFLWSKTSLKK